MDLTSKSWSGISAWGAWAGVVVAIINLVTQYWWRRSDKKGKLTPQRDSQEISSSQVTQNELLQAILAESRYQSRLLERLGENDTIGIAL